MGAGGWWPCKGERYDSGGSEPIAWSRLQEERAYLYELVDFPNPTTHPASG